MVTACINIADVARVVSAVQVQSEMERHMEDAPTTAHGAARRCAALPACRPPPSVGCAAAV